MSRQVSHLLCPTSSPTQSTSPREVARIWALFVKIQGFLGKLNDLLLLRKILFCAKFGGQRIPFWSSLIPTPLHSLCLKVFPSKQQNKILLHTHHTGNTYPRHMILNTRSLCQIYYKLITSFPQWEISAWLLRNVSWIGFVEKPDWINVKFCNFISLGCF